MKKAVLISLLLLLCLISVVQAYKFELKFKDIKVIVNGHTYNYPEEIPEVPKRATVTIKGAFEYRGSPVSDATVILYGYNNKGEWVELDRDETDSEGRFEFTFKVPDWEKIDFCGESLVFAKVKIEWTYNGNNMWRAKSITGVAVCSTPKPTPTPTSTPTPTPNPTETPAGEWNFKWDENKSKVALASLGCFTVAILALTLSRRGRR